MKFWLLLLLVASALCDFNPLEDAGESSSTSFSTSAPTDPSTSAGASSTASGSSSTSSSAVNPSTAIGGSTTSATPPDYNFKVKVLRVENTAGTLASGDPCSEFAFAGTQCSMTLSVCVSSGTDRSQCGGDDQVLSLPAESNSANIVGNSKKIELPDGNFDSFTVFVQVGQGEDATAVDSYNFTVTDSSPQGIMTYSHPRANTIATSLKLAWTINAAPTTTAPATTEAGTTATSGSTESTTSGTTTVAPTTTVPLVAYDCDDFPDKTNGVKTITINGNGTLVYCEYGTSGGAYTTIQSRGSVQSVTFNRTFDEYKESFGAPGVGNDFWLGLENIYNLTSTGNYGLIIDLCCSGAATEQRYNSFSIGALETNYTLSAESEQTTGLNITGPNTQRRDIGAQFSTYDRLSDDFLEGCDILKYYGNDYTPIFDHATGGWWFGSCANNLNGASVAATAYNTTVPTEQCLLIEDKISSVGTGIEMRTNTRPTYVQRAFDGVSYDRVRMAIYNKEKPPLGIPPNSFCV